MRQTSLFKGKTAPKLSADDVAEIRRCFEHRKMLQHYIDTQISTKALAERFGVAAATVWKIESQYIWKEPRVVPKK